MKRKPRRNDNPELRAAWMAEHGDRCACCWVPAGTYGVRLDAHHIVKGKDGRPDDARALLALCWSFGRTPQCHSLAEGILTHPPQSDTFLGSSIHLAPLTLGMCLWLKRESDPTNYDPEWLAAALHRRLPELEPIPSLLLAERNRWNPLPRMV